DPDLHAGRGPDGDPVKSAEDRLEQSQLLHLVTQLLVEMPENERLVISLYYFEGLRMKEIGRVLELTESRISQIHQLAIAALRARIMEALGW
ncbi:MAG: sigma-70 family RNA polymerase sigma factor, partial [Gemmatimonadetes bacterium]|nr:sigma-70 family RNA polymerase sigma factor [Gemmatimonadota bacterium]